MYILMFVFCFTSFCLEDSMFFRTLSLVGIFVTLIVAYYAMSPLVYVGFTLLFPTVCYKFRNVKI
jgi:hypothetical protein